MLPADTVREIAALGSKAEQLNKPRILKCDQEPDHCYYVIDKDGNMNLVTAEYGPTEMFCSDIDTLTRVVIDSKEHMPEIWYSRNEVIAYLGTKNPYFDTVKFKLSASPQFQTLIAWEQSGRGVSLTQKDLILALRTLFAGCVPTELLPAIRRLKTQKAAEINSQIDKGRVSMSKSMVAEMSGVSDIPEMVEFTVPVFAQGTLNATACIRVAIDPDPENERFTLIVLPGDVEKAWTHGERLLCGKIQEELVENWSAAKGEGDCEIPVYFGKAS
jgi:hypothetical protein